MSHPNKRKRSVSPVSREEPTQENTPIIRNNDIYFDDGNIILIAEFTAFRVHKGQMARRSDVFRDMFDLPGQPQDAEIFDGCPVVRLSDSSKDILVLLQAMYGDHINLDPEYPDSIISVLRLSSKYLIDHLRAAAIIALAKAYPDRLDLFMEYKGQRIYTSQVIKIAHEVQAEILLPAAYYDLCCRPSSTVISSEFPSFVLERCLSGKEILPIKLIDFVNNTIMTRAGTSCATLHCDDIWAYLLSRFHQKLQNAGAITSPDTLECIERCTKLKRVPEACQGCREALFMAAEDAKERIWCSLPEIFNLGTWEGLRKAAP